MLCFPIEDGNSTSEEEVWDNQSDSDYEYQQDNTAITQSELEGQVRMQALVKWLVLFILSWLSISSSAIGYLLAFVGKVLSILAVITASPIVVCLATIFPASLYLTYKFLKINRKNFLVFAVCGRCYSICSLDSCLSRKPDSSFVANAANS